VKFLESEEPPTGINELVVLTHEPAKNQWLRISSFEFFRTPVTGEDWCFDVEKLIICFTMVRNCGKRVR
jgi:hypothetical protein